MMKTWIVNSNNNDDNGNPNGYLFMLRQNRVAAFYQRAEDVEKISIGDLILLYHNKNRIIAVGFAVQNSSHDFRDMASIERWVDVNWIWKANFDNSLQPTNSIKRPDLNITSVRKTINNVTNEINLTSLLTEIGKKQSNLI